MNGSCFISFTPCELRRCIESRQIINSNPTVVALSERLSLFVESSISALMGPNSCENNNEKKIFTEVKQNKEIKEIMEFILTLV